MAALARSLAGHHLHVVAANSAGRPEGQTLLLGAGSGAHNSPKGKRQKSKGEREKVNLWRPALFCRLLVNILGGITGEKIDCSIKTRPKLGPKLFAPKANRLSEERKHKSPGGAHKHTSTLTHKLSHKADDKAPTGLLPPHLLASGGPFLGPKCGRIFHLRATATRWAQLGVPSGQSSPFASLLSCRRSPNDTC